MTKKTVYKFTYARAQHNNRPYDFYLKFGAKLLLETDQAQAMQATYSEVLNMLRKYANIGNYDCDNVRTRLQSVKLAVASFLYFDDIPLLRE